MRTDHLIEPNAACLPCKKEELCQQTARAMLNVGHSLMLQGAWTEAGLNRWNAMLDTFIAEAKAALENGPLASGTGSPASAPGGVDIRRGPG